VFGLTRPGLEHTIYHTRPGLELTIYHTRGDHPNPFTGLRTNPMYL